MGRVYLQTRKCLPLRVIVTKFWNGIHTSLITYLEEDEGVGRDDVEVEVNGKLLRHGTGKGENITI